MMPSIKLDLKKMQATARGTVVIDLGKVVPVKSETEQQIEMIMSMNLGGQKQDMTTKTSMKMKLESK